MKQGIPVVIAGKPNAGKSTLLNTLLNEERAIVSHIPGTTRDTVEEEIILAGIKFRFIDTAGLRSTTNVIESIGVNRTYEKIRQSPVLLYLFDVNETTTETLNSELSELSKTVDLDKMNLILIGNKIDASINHQITKSSDHQIILLSAKEKTNIDVVIEKLIEVAGEKKLQSGAIVTNARHAEALQKTLEHLLKAEENIRSNMSGDLLAADIRYALHHLGEITGEITTDDLLENIFSKFCIGK
jgi:tRNA modification GTPase